MDAEGLVRLEYDAWASETMRLLYGTPLIPGFPWYTTPTDSKHPARRHVVPYYYTFRVFVKGRWVGRSLLDVYSEEHAHHSRQYYETCIQQGRLRRQERVHHNVRKNHLKRSLGVDWFNENNAVRNVQESVVLEAGDVVLHTVHRHEIPVSVGTTGVDPIVILMVRITAYGLIVVNKPAGIPTHASGRYFMNSCTAMLEYVLAPKRLHAWLVKRDPLLQSLVSTAQLSDVECEELLAYYNTRNGEHVAGDSVSIERLPRPCHRLDRVTSGVLLLGVSRSATRRVGEALANKTKQMEEVFLQQLPSVNLTVNDGASKVERDWRKECEVQGIEQSVLEGFDVGVRKRYLARVHGRFPECALQSSRAQSTAAKNSEEDKGRLAHDAIFTVTNINTSTNCAGQKDGEVKQVFDRFDPPVLLASPLLQSRFCNYDSTEKLLPLQTSSCKHENKEKRHIVSQAAATFCQPLRYFYSCSQNDCETLVQCIPFSGRMHQIRMHLGDWGHPIIGDVSYSAEESRFICLNGSLVPKECDKADKNHTNDETVVYFCANDLPKTCREAFYTYDAHCWECTGQIPLACFGDRNSGTIALHAWRYELDHHLLLGKNSDNAADSVFLELTEEKEEEMDDLWEQKAGFQEKIINHGDEKGAFGLCCTWKDVTLRQKESVWYKKKKVVIFSAPPPSWSQ